MSVKKPVKPMLVWAVLDGKRLIATFPNRTLAREMAKVSEVKPLIVKKFKLVAVK